MAMDYFKNRRRSSQIIQTPNPVLSSEDEAFLQHIVSQQEHTPRSAGPVVSNDGKPTEPVAEIPAQPELGETAQDVPLPASPAEEFSKELGEEARETTDTPDTQSEPPKQEESNPTDKKKKRWTAMFWKKDSGSKKVRMVIIDTRITSAY